MTKPENGRRNFLIKTVTAGFTIAWAKPASAVLAAGTPPKTIRVGIIGLSVHAADFTEILNSNTGNPEFAGCQVVALYHPKGNPDVEFSAEQLGKFTSKVTGLGVELVGSVEDLIKKSDAVMLLTNDGRPHLEQITPVLKAGKPVYIDKPIADTFAHVIAIFKAARQYGTPVFSSSALRYVKDIRSLAEGKVAGEVIGADTYGPAPLQKSHVDLFWDGIHAIELLYAVMGPGCKTVTRIHTEDTDVVTGTWAGGKIGVFRGLRKGKIGFGGTVYGSAGISDIGKFEGYKNLVVAIAEFFQTKRAPVTEKETIEIYAFMEAAEESKRLGGIPVSIVGTLSRAGID